MSTFQSALMILKSFVSNSASLIMSLNIGHHGQLVCAASSRILAIVVGIWNKFSSSSSGTLRSAWRGLD
jgi:hypothetical protein